MGQRSEQGKLLQGAAQGSEQTLCKHSDAHVKLDILKELIEAYPGQTRPVANEVEAVERLLKEGTFYEPVSNEEMRAVVEAMASEFRGTGHWVSTFLLPVQGF